MVVPLPDCTDDGDAESVHVGAGGGGGGVEATVIAVEQVVSPPGPLTVMVYVCPLVTETAVEPASTGPAAPTPLSIVALVPATLVHEIVEEPPPAGSTDGTAVSVH